MQKRPLIIMHGYSDAGNSFESWQQKFKNTRDHIWICNYRTLTNEISIKDIAEGFDQSLLDKATTAGIETEKLNEFEFDAIVHSTGMLVIRSWLAEHPGRQKRLKCLIGLAPATFGSPLAHKGRTWWGSIIKGNPEAGPDFMESGDMVLDGLELASPFTWDLAHLDLLGNQQSFDDSPDTPYVFCFIGLDKWTGIKRLANEEGSDGTIRWAGAALNARKITVDLTKPKDQISSPIAPPNGTTAMPFTLVKGVNHGTIKDANNGTIPLTGGGEASLLEAVTEALAVASAEAFEQWRNKYPSRPPHAHYADEKWQQFIVRAIDERGDPITDYNINIIDSGNQLLDAFELDVHVYKNDASFRCFHVNLNDLQLQQLDKDKLSIVIWASSGTHFIEYLAYNGSKIEVDEITIPFSRLENIQLFYPFTTTLIEIRLNREPTRIGNGRPYNHVLTF